MNSIRKSFGPSLAAGLMSLLLGLAGTQIRAGDTSPGYLESSSGNIVQSGGGDCMRTGQWEAGMATVVGCDEYTLDLQAEVIEGAPSGMIGAIIIPEAALFAFDSSQLTEGAEQVIETYRKALRPEISEAYAAVIIGHTDSIGNADYNMKLSRKRAQAVSDYLVSTGVDASKLRIVGRGEDAPIASNDTKKGQAQNRRVEVVTIAEPRALDMIRFPSVALFPRRSAELTNQGKAMLASSEQEAREMLSRASYIEVVGHTDHVGDDDYNQELSEQRAEAVRNHLIAAGVDGNKIVSVGAGENMPIASNKTEEGRAQNRRVEVLMLGRVKSSQ